MKKYSAIALAIIVISILVWPKIALGAEPRTVISDYPLLVVGDTASLNSILQSAKLEGKPVVFFSRTYKAKEPTDILRFAKSVAFFDGGIMDLAIDLLPAAMPDSRGGNTLSRVIPARDKARFETPQSGYYDIFLRTVKGSKAGDSELDSRQKLSVKKYHYQANALINKSIVRLSRETTDGDWNYIGTVHLSKGAHSLRVRSSVDFVVVVPQKSFVKHVYGIAKLVVGKTLVLWPRRQTADLNEDKVEVIYGGNSAVEEDEAKTVFRKVNPTRYIIESESKDPYWLVFSETYHPGWRAYPISNQGSGSRFWETWFKVPIPESRHFMVNGYANGWRVDKGGSYMIILDFWPQRLFYAGSVLSVVTLAVCIGYLIYYRKRRLRVG